MAAPFRSCATAAASVSGVVRHRAGYPPKTTDDFLAAEEPLEIRVNGRSVSVTMRTPGHDEELAAGFLFTEGMIHAPGDLAATTVTGNVVDVTLAPGVDAALERLTRHVFASSSCGLCGKASIANLQTQFPPLPADDVRLSLAALRALAPTLRAAQDTFTQTGGLHAAGLFDLAGNLLAAREDVGRHNAVDKVVGHGLLQNTLPFASHVLLVSGRASFEILQKALAARVPIIAAVSAPSSLAVEFARANRQTLVGFLRDTSLNIYTHPERIVP